MVRWIPVESLPVWWWGVVSARGVGWVWVSDPDAEAAEDGDDDEGGDAQHEAQGLGLRGGGLGPRWGAGGLWWWGGGRFGRASAPAWKNWGLVVGCPAAGMGPLSGAQVRVGGGVERGSGPEPAGSGEAVLAAGVGVGVAAGGGDGTNVGARVAAGPGRTASWLCRSRVAA